MLVHQTKNLQGARSGPLGQAPDNVTELANTPAHIQIGPDAVTLLCGFGLNLFRNRYALWDALVQVGPEGTITRRVNPRHIFTPDHSFGTYGKFLRDYLLPRAERLGAELGALSETKRRDALNSLVVRSTECPRTFWALSSNYVRPYLFPAAYAPGTRRRIDRIRYKVLEARPQQNGSFISPRSLDKADVEDWKAEVSHQFPAYDVDRYGPIVA